MFDLDENAPMGSGIAFEAEDAGRIRPGRRKGAPRSNSARNDPWPRAELKVR